MNEQPSIMRPVTDPAILAVLNSKFECDTQEIRMREDKWERIQPKDEIIQEFPAEQAIGPGAEGFTRLVKRYEPQYIEKNTFPNIPTKEDLMQEIRYSAFNVLEHYSMDKRLIATYRV